MAKNSKEVQRKADAKRAGKRSRSWACILYPESAPADWKTILSDTHMEIIVSPIHDKDVTAKGEPKKPHYHVMALWANPASETTAANLFSLIGVTAPPEYVRNIKGYARYLVHMDDHDKHRYSESDVMCFGGASWAAVAGDEARQEDKTLMEIEDWIDEYNETSYRQLCRYARSERPDWYYTIRTHTIHLTHYLKSLKWEMNQ